MRLNQAEWATIGLLTVAAFGVFTMSWTVASVAGCAAMYVITNEINGTD